MAKIFIRTTLGIVIYKIEVVWGIELSIIKIISLVVVIVLAIHNRTLPHNILSKNTFQAKYLRNSIPAVRNRNLRSNADLKFVSVNLFDLFMIIDLLSISK
jgi:hypothetical protein